MVWITTVVEAREAELRLLTNLLGVGSVGEATLRVGGAVVATGALLDAGVAVPGVAGAPVEEASGSSGAASELVADEEAEAGGEAEEAVEEEDAGVGGGALAHSWRTK